MRTEVTVVTETDRLVFGYWDVEADMFVELSDSNNVKEIADAAEKLGCTPLLVDALVLLTDGIAEAVGQDLKDIWKKVNK